MAKSEAEVPVAEQLDVFNAAAAGLCKLPREQQMRTLAALVVLFDARHEVRRRTED